MSEEMNVERTEMQNNSAELGEGTQSQDKTFTQEEVDKIVEKRLSRERKKLASALGDPDPREQAVIERERAVEIKELRAEASTALNDKGIPLEALELLNYTDKETCDKSIETLVEVYTAMQRKNAAVLLRGGRPIKRASSTGGEAESLRKAFGLDFTE